MSIAALAEASAKTDVGHRESLRIAQPGREAGNRRGLVLQSVNTLRRDLNGTVDRFVIKREPARSYVDAQPMRADANPVRLVTSIGRLTSNA